MKCNSVKEGEMGISLGQRGPRKFRKYKYY